MSPAFLCAPLLCPLSLKVNSPEYADLIRTLIVCACFGIQFRLTFNPIRCGGWPKRPRINPILLQNDKKECWDATTITDMLMFDESSI